MSKKIIATIILVAVLLIGSLAYFFTRPKTEFDRLGKLKKLHPEWAVYVDDLVAETKKYNDGTNTRESYLAIAMAWKTLADRTKNPEQYREALSIYEAGIATSEGKDFLMYDNAGSMAIYLGDYTLAETYYKKAIELSPGTAGLYEKLAELYEYKLKKPSAEIIALYDAAIKNVVLNPGYPVELKKSYLERVKNK